MINQPSIFHNLAIGKTLSDKLDIIIRDASDIDTLCDLISGFNTEITDEPIINANFIVQRLAREIAINSVGASDQLELQEGRNA